MTVGARSGDWVKARDVWWTPKKIEGILHLRMDQYGEIDVVLENTDSFWPPIVIADSVEVIESGVVPADTFDRQDREDFYFRYPDYNRKHPVYDLTKAIDADLISLVSSRKPGFLKRLHERTLSLVTPLRNAGWTQCGSRSYSDGQLLSWMVSLKRKGTRIGVEVFEIGGIQGWVYDADYEPDLEGDPEADTPDFDGIGEDSELFALFEERGWLQQ